MKLFDYLMEPIGNLTIIGAQSDPIPEGMGRCMGCGELFYVGENGWDGTDGGTHRAEFDTGGGNVEEIDCGEVVRGE